MLGYIHLKYTLKVGKIFITLYMLTFGQPWFPDNNAIHRPQTSTQHNLTKHTSGAQVIPMLWLI